MVTFRLLPSKRLSTFQFVYDEACLAMRLNVYSRSNCDIRFRFAQVSSDAAKAVAKNAFYTLALCLSGIFQSALLSLAGSLTSLNRMN